MKKILRNHPRGFALLLVMLIAVACVTVAIALTSIGGKGEVAAIHAEGGEAAKMLAESGIERMAAYADAVRGANTDYDRVLDPKIGTVGQQANCLGLAVSPFNFDPAAATPHAGTETFLPQFTEAGTSRVEFPVGSKKFWREVPAAGGAYLTRFEDNADDGPVNTNWAAETSNNLGGASLCAEGPALLGGENPARDRDNAIWAIAIGIYPGTDPTRAAHRQVMRKLIANANTPAAPAFYVGLDVGGNVQLHNQKGSVVAGGNISGIQACGEISAAGTNTSVDSGAGTCPPNNSAACLCNLNEPFVLLASQTIPPPVAPQPVLGWTPRDAFWYDYTNPCNFYIDQTLGFFYWDPTATFGANSCNNAAQVGNLPTPSTNTGTAGSCWVPIILPVGGGNSSMYTPYVSSLVPNGRGAEAALEPPNTPNNPVGWFPQGLAAGGLVANAVVDPAAGAIPDKYYAGAAVTNRALPNWSQCGSAAFLPSELGWGTAPPNPTPPPVAFDETCLPTECNGSTKALDFNIGTQVAFNFGSNAGRAAAPTGVYFVANDYNVPNTFNCFPDDQTNPAPNATVWPMITLVVENDYTQPNNNDLCWGVGTSKGLYASFVVGRDFNEGAGTATFHSAGSLYVKRDINIKKSAQIWGLVRVDGNFTQGPGGGPIEWKYIRDIANTQASSGKGVRFAITSPTGF